MEKLEHQDLCGPELADEKIPRGRNTVSAVNHWALGWPQRVQGLVKEQIYWACLMA